MKKRLVKWTVMWLRVAGWTLLMGAFVLMVVGYVTILMTQGVGALLDIIHPLNVFNWLATIAVLAPGAIALWAAEQLDGSA